MSLTFGLIFAVAVPSTFSLTARWRWDNWLGELSYPVYLWHVLVISLLTVAWQGPYNVGIHLATLLVAVITVVVVDRPVERWRQARVADARKGEALALAPA